MDIKNVLFLAPSYPYAKTVVENLQKELTRCDIPHTCSIKSGNVYVKTDDVFVDIVYIDPLKYTPELFMRRDLIFGKKILVDKVSKDYAKSSLMIADCSLSKYLRDMYKYSRDRELTPFYAAKSKPRNTYIPEISKVHFNDPVTVVIWEDGTKTTVRCQEGDIFSPEIGLSLCITKKALGNMPNFNNVFRKWCPEEETRKYTWTANVYTVQSKFNSKLTEAVDKAIQDALTRMNEDKRGVE